MNKNNGKNISIIKLFVWIYLLISVSLNLLSGFSGFMANTVRDIGSRREHFDQYQSFIINGGELTVQYTIDIEANSIAPCSTSFYPDHIIVEGEKRLGVVDLASGWRTPEIIKDEKDLHWWGRSTSWWDRNRIHLSPSEGRLSQKNETYVDLKANKEPWYHSMEKTKPDYNKAEETMKHQIQECLGDSLYCINYPYGHRSREFVILKKDNDSGNDQYKYVAVKENDYYESWAKYVHFVLFPFAIIFDVLVLPLTLITFLCM